MISVFNYNERPNDEIFFLYSGPQFAPKLGLKYLKKKKKTRHFFSFSHLLEVAQIHIKNQSFINSSFFDNSLTYIKRIFNNFNLFETAQVVASHWNKLPKPWYIKDEWVRHKFENPKRKLWKLEYALKKNLFNSLKKIYKEQRRSELNKKNKNYQPWPKHNFSKLTTPHKKKYKFKTLLNILKKLWKFTKKTLKKKLKVQNSIINWKNSMVSILKFVILKFKTKNNKFFARFKQFCRRKANSKVGSYMQSWSGLEMYLLFVFIKHFHSTTLQKELPQFWNRKEKSIGKSLQKLQTTFNILQKIPSLKSRFVNAVTSSNKLPQRHIFVKWFITLKRLKKWPIATLNVSRLFKVYKKSWFKKFKNLKKNCKKNIKKDTMDLFILFHIRTSKQIKKIWSIIQYYKKIYKTTFRYWYSKLICKGGLWYKLFAKHKKVFKTYKRFKRYKQKYKRYKRFQQKFFLYPSIFQMYQKASRKHKIFFTLFLKHMKQSKKNSKKNFRNFILKSKKFNELKKTFKLYNNFQFLLFIRFKHWMFAQFVNYKWIFSYFQKNRSFVKIIKKFVVGAFKKWVSKQWHKFWKHKRTKNINKFLRNLPQSRAHIYSNFNYAIDQAVINSYLFKKPDGISEFDNLFLPKEKENFSGWIRNIWQNHWEEVWQYFKSQWEQKRQHFKSKWKRKGKQKLWNFLQYKKYIFNRYWNTQLKYKKPHWKEQWKSQAFKYEWEWQKILFYQKLLNTRYFFSRNSLILHQLTSNLNPPSYKWLLLFKFRRMYKWNRVFKYLKGLKVLKELTRKKFSNFNKIVFNLKHKFLLRMEQLREKLTKSLYEKQKIKLNQLFLVWKNNKWEFENDRLFISNYFTWLRKKYKLRSRWISKEIQDFVDIPLELVNDKVNIFNPIVRSYIEFLNKDSINLIEWIDIPYDARKDIPFDDQNPQLSLYFNLWNRMVYNNRYNYVDLRYSKKVRGFEFPKSVFMWHKFTLFAPINYENVIELIRRLVNSDWKNI